VDFADMLEKAHVLLGREEVGIWSQLIEEALEFGDPELVELGREGIRAAYAEEGVGS
jgi:hypothetical protein